MSNKRQRIFGTTDEAIAKAETELNFKFPSSFRYWLIQNNGLRIEDVTIFPVFDERNSGKTFDSIVRNYKVNWLDWLENFEDEEISFEHLLPFAEFGTGDYYCFDYSNKSNNEIPVVHWSMKQERLNFVLLTLKTFLKNLNVVILNLINKKDKCAE